MLHGQLIRQHQAYPRQKGKATQRVTSNGKLMRRQFRICQSSFPTHEESTNSSGAYHHRGRVEDNLDLTAGLTKVPHDQTFLEFRISRCSLNNFHKHLCFDNEDSKMFAEF